VKSGSIRRVLNVFENRLSGNVAKWETSAAFSATRAFAEKKSRAKGSRLANTLSIYAREKFRSRC